ncbi:Deazaflavin-dependent nitroreductase [BD1-7 clade bacterium]|uniref:Deazaflavin-dependent nitroreductase n=1 Tax=BD1-7 clade bacterium TaxID=2029982 RepID=A0A5S9MZ37_9GAMM|nr:Deazaflavin-dependent nitroreductase [BD1-7 clade bacterium]
MKKYDYVKTRREDVDEIPEKWVWLVRGIIKRYTRFNVWVYKKSGGRLMKNFPGGFPICIVGMRGRKSGLRREVALIHLPYGESRLLVASQGGMDKDPVWFHNIKANPDIDIMVAGDTREFVARQLGTEEKIDVWPHLLSLYPDFDEYQARTDRDIPVFICEPVNPN